MYFAFEFDSFRLVLYEIKCAFNGYIYTKLFKFLLNKKNKHETQKKRKKKQVTKAKVERARY